jgi:hypothetical protein
VFQGSPIGFHSPGVDAQKQKPTQLSHHLGQSTGRLKEFIMRREFQNAVRR